MRFYLSLQLHLCCRDGKCRYFFLPLLLFLHHLFFFFFFLAAVLIIEMAVLAPAQRRDARPSCPTSLNSSLRKTYKVLGAL